ncbi:MAG: peptide deformylase [Candidatus Caldarchaeum sp.]
MPRIRVWPDGILRVVCDPVGDGEDIDSLLEDLFSVAHQNDLLGLAANQIGVSKRVFVWRRRLGKTQYFDVAINPRIVHASPVKVGADEGCASLPGLTVFVSRPRYIEVEYEDVDRVLQREGLEFPEAAIFQHELDHLNGKYIVDYLDLQQRERALRDWIMARRKR